jgi:tRNA(adenine34) deaminase
MLDTHVKFMDAALALALKAGDRGEVPIAAVLVKAGKIVARAHNLTRTKKDPTGHAEMVVIRNAIAKLRNERFLDTTLYVTLEPCAMCAGAIVQARIPVVVFGAYDAKAGACGSVFKILPSRKLNHRPTVISEVLAESSVQLLQDFFKRRRRAKKRQKLENGN